MTTFKNEPENVPMEPTEKIKHHRGSEYHSHIEPQKDTITVEPTENHIHCETTRNIWGYKGPVKMDEPVWKNSMCN